MTIEKPTIDPYLFERQFSAFSKFVEEQSGIKFVSFSSNPYTDEQEGYKQEGYKYEIQRAARETLAFQAWRTSDIGKGEILAAVIEAIEIPNSNLVPWQGRFGNSPVFSAIKMPGISKHGNVTLKKGVSSRITSSGTGSTRSR